MKREDQMTDDEIRHDEAVMRGWPDFTPEEERDIEIGMAEQQKMSAEMTLARIAREVRDEANLDLFGGAA